MANVSQEFYYICLLILMDSFTIWNVTPKKINILIFYNIDDHILIKEKSYRKRTITMQCLWSGRTCTLLSFSCQRQTNYGPTSWAQHEYKKQEKVLRDCPFLHRPSLSDYYRLNHARTAKSACGCLVMFVGRPTILSWTILPYFTIFWSSKFGYAVEMTASLIERVIIRCAPRLTLTLPRRQL